MSRVYLVAVALGPLGHRPLDVPYKALKLRASAPRSRKIAISQKQSERGAHTFRRECIEAVGERLAVDVRAVSHIAKCGPPIGELHVRKRNHVFAADLGLPVRILGW